MRKSFIMAPPSTQFIEHFNLYPKAALSQWLEVRRALHDTGANVMIADGEADTGRLGVFWKQERHFKDNIGDLLKLVAPVSYEQIVFDKDANILWYGFTCDEEFQHKKILDSIFDGTDITVRALPIELKDQYPTLSHCMNVLPNGTLIWVPECFSEYTRGILESFYSRNICIGGQDALNYVCGCISVGNTVISGPMSTTLKTHLSLSQDIIEVDVREWLAKRLTLKSLANEIIQ